MISPPNLLSRLKKLLRGPWDAVVITTTMCALQPVRDIQVSGNALLSFHIDPQFNVTPLQPPLRRGWYRISYNASVDAPDALFTPKIYTGHGQLREQDAIVLQPHVGGRIQQIMFLPEAVNRFRLDPFDMDYPYTDFPVLGRFAVDNLTLVRIGAAGFFFYCLFHGLRPVRSRRLSKNIKLFGQLLLGRGYAITRRWLIHRAKSALMPPLTLTQWFHHYRHFNPVATQPANSGETVSNRLRLLMLLPLEKGKISSAKYTIQSLLAQSHDQWQLLLFPIGNFQPDVIQDLQTLVKDDARLGTIEHMPQSLSELPGLESSDFICTLSPGDQLVDGALAEVCNTLYQENSDVIYADEARLQQNRIDLNQLNLRTAFSLDGFLSAPTTGFFTFVRTKTLDPDKSIPSVSNFAFNEWLFLNALGQSRKITHVADILYFLDPDSQPPSRLPVEFFTDFLQKRGFKQAQVTTTATSGCYSVRYHTRNCSKIAIIIPTHNRVDLLQAAVTSLATTVPQSLYQLLIVDHQSDESATVEYLSRLEKTHTVIRHDGPFNFSKINNIAVDRVGDDCDTLLFLNNDIEAIESGWLESMLDKVGRNDVGAVGATLLYPDGHLQHAGVITGMGMADHFMGGAPYSSPYREHLSSTVLPWIVTRDFSAVTAACLAIRKDLFRDTGGFDEKLAIGFQDVDLCLRLKQKGYHNLCDGEAVLIHHTSATRTTSDIQALSMNDPVFRLHQGDPHFEDTVLFSTRYQAQLMRADPYYHPLLSRLTQRYRLCRGTERAASPEIRTVDWQGQVH
ncbi:MAG: glycosyltransferase [Proteobacteria bacterium]|nr:glycosyltransferase [Pseudomonadota bacterium]